MAVDDEFADARSITTWAFVTPQMRLNVSHSDDRGDMSCPEWEEIEYWKLIPYSRSDEAGSIPVDVKMNFFRWACRKSGTYRFFLTSGN